jgi:biopolymer transport protein ExbB/TolQ
MAWIVVVEWLARLILLVLILLSVWSISIILDRKKFFKLGLNDLADQYKKVIQGHIHLESASAYFMATKRKEMEKGLSVLGTLGSTTPFIGLLGTILGIIVAFGELSQGKADTNAIMFALAEALILTAVGLGVAIPAVIAFNFFGKKIRNILGDLDILKHQYLSEKKD